MEVDIPLKISAKEKILGILCVLVVTGVTRVTAK